MSKKIKQELKDYNDPNVLGTLGSVKEYARTNQIPLAKAQKILEKNLAYTLHKPRRKRCTFRPVLVFNKDEHWVADLIEVQKLARENKGYRFILTVIDVLSKHAWAEPLKRKTGKEVTEAFQRVLRKAQGRRPLQLQTDDGKEFYNRTFQDLMKRRDIRHFSTKGDTKGSIIERFNRTLKSKMYRYFTASNSLRYVDVLPKLVDQYNNTYHRSIGMTPAKVTDENADIVWYRLYDKDQYAAKKKATPFKKGDRVRLNKQMRTFLKGYLPGWTEEIFIVDRVVPTYGTTTYKIKELDGTLLTGSFYAWDLQKVTVDVDSLFRIEKVLKRDQKGGTLRRWGQQVGSGWVDDVVADAKYRWGPRSQTGDGLEDILKNAAMAAIRPTAATALKTMAENINPSNPVPVKKATQQAMQLQQKAAVQAAQAVQSSEDVAPALLQPPASQAVAAIVPSNAYTTNVPRGVPQGATTPYLTPATAAPTPIAPVQKETPRPKTPVPKATSKRAAPKRAGSSELKRRRLLDVFGN
ncbi:putative uncharacterized transposon-derived protein F54H12.3 [Stylophora pistillata]|uniref:Uncharacterized transposon-derived protein F54H12.3 n=1 Tax=Stylophora pistillata TaxID=50429 RepID=A0A2B4R736_STYPI|nr:putative uncharacterized transposon-derived protein F54H12.3 [Stylophora pistillata]